MRKAGQCAGRSGWRTSYRQRRPASPASQSGFLPGSMPGLTAGIGDRVRRWHLLLALCRGKQPELSSQSLLMLFGKNINAHRGMVGQHKICKKGNSVRHLPSAFMPSGLAPRTVGKIAGAHPGLYCWRAVPRPCFRRYCWVPSSDLATMKKTAARSRPRHTTFAHGLKGRLCRRWIKTFEDYSIGVKHVYG